MLAATLCGSACAADEAPNKPDEPTEHKPPEHKPDIEGAIGLLTRYSPDYPGAPENSASFRPAGFLRWGRITITGAGGFTTRRNDEVERGLGAELVRRPAFKLRLGLRLDNGRSEADSPRLAGMGEIKRTVRARVSGQWDIAEDWRVGAGISLDTLNKGGGYLVEVSLAREWKLANDGTFTVSAAVAGAGDRYMQTWHGVTPEQSLRSGLPAYSAAEGLRHVQLGAVWRTELSPRWAGFVGGGVMRLLGSAADSPLTKQAGGASASAGLAWRF